MNSNHFLNILKTITETMKCPTCGHSYDLSEIQFINQFDGFCLVHLTCGSCKVPVWVNFFAGDKKPNFKIETQPMDESILFEEITSDEILTFHEYLKGFNGNFREAFSQK